MVTPTVQEDKMVEKLLGIAVPTREEMQEIEVSSRLYVENGARYMTATLMCQSDTATPKTTPVTFILSGHKLATVRYDDPRPFAIVEHKLARSCPAKITGELVMMDLLDAVVDRSADILERIGVEVDQVSHTIFEPEDEPKPPSYKDVLKALGRKGDLTSKVRESLVSIGRLLLFLSNEAESMRWAKDVRAHLQSMRRDTASLSDLFAGRDAGCGQHRTKCHHQNLLDRGGDLHAAYAGGLDLRDEFPQGDGRARVGIRISLRTDIDGARCRLADRLLSMEEVAVTCGQ
jgi:magnesium transporter